MKHRFCRARFAGKTFRRCGGRFTLLLAGGGLAAAIAGARAGLPAPAEAAPAEPLTAQFQTPPASAQPWVFWMWLRTETTPAAITRDLEEMHAKGIAGAILYDSGVGGGLEVASKMVLRGKGYQPVRTAEFAGARIDPLPRDPLLSWTPHSREMVRFAAKEAARVGVKLCLTVGLAGTSGPIDAEYGQQKLLWSETNVNGPARYDEVLPPPSEAVPTTSAGVKPGNRPGPMRGTSSPPFSGHEVAVLAVPGKEPFVPAEVLNLSAKLEAGGRLRWDVPAGQWRILRFAYAPTGKKNAWGLYTDGMSAEAMDQTWAATIGPLLREMTPAERRGLMGIEDDSWEAGETTWTKQFPAEFARRRHYDLIPWLPALTGKAMGTADEAVGVRRDYYRTIADLVATNHYARLRQLARQNGLICYSEPSGPNTPQLDLMQDCRGVDVAMGEFWVPSVHRPTPARRFLLRNAASANHIYGQPLTPCEGFTSVGPFWEESFFEMKATGDQAFCDGCNLMVVHNYSHSPSVTAKPGYVYFAGTHYNRNVTWWEQTPAFNAYLGRCAFLLQQGRFVADALFYRGDGIGQGEQMKTKPAWPAEGYDHDNCNLDALLTRVSVKHGRLVLPDGMSYQLLVLPDEAPLAPEALEKIAALVDAGAAVTGPRPRGMAGLATSRAQKDRFDALVARLWASGADTTTRDTARRVLSGHAPADLLRAAGVAPDLEYTGLSAEGELDWIHRTTGEADIYFIASRWDPHERVACSFRVAGKQPEIFDPVTGEIREAPAFRQESGRTIVPLEFDPRQSVFVVFRKPMAANVQGRAVSNYPTMHPQAELSGPWEVSFEAKWGGPEKVTFEALADWTRRPEAGIRFYSGTAIYRKNFSLAALPLAGEKVLLDLGEVHEVAAVRVNGVDLGVLWTKPARVDITRAARVGENRLVVTVVNLWPNRLIGDAGLPPAQRFTETNIRKFTPATPLYPSGLLGPVRVERAVPPALAPP